MSRGAHIHEILALPEKDKLKGVLIICSRQKADVHLQALRKRFAKWVEYSNEVKKLQQEEELRQKVVEILQQSVRGQRSTMEKEMIRRFLVSNLSCLPKAITFSEMDKLCNEVDWLPLIGRSILFLQGDFGNVYYMVAKGSVGLYLEPSKDREMAIAREFGNLRGQPFKGSDEDLVRLGNNIFNLPKGAGFGEYAILASTNKIRSCAAVALDADSMLLVMHADTYNAVLRQHHYRQKQLSSATALLQELPLFKQHNYSKIASLAYTMKSQTYSSGTMIVRSGELINNVLLIAAGQVKVFASHKDLPSANQPDFSSSSGSQKVMEKRIPKLAVAMLGRGQIIGETELMKGMRFFQMSYETSAASTEILEMPATVFKESISQNEFLQSSLFRSIEGMNEEKEQTRTHRLTRAYGVMKKMMEGDSKKIKKKEEMLSILPTIIDPFASHTISMSLKAHREQLVNNIYSAEGAVAVTRRQLSSSSESGKFRGTAQTNGNGVVPSPPSASPTVARPSALRQSPRKITFGSSSQR